MGVLNLWLKPLFQLMRSNTGYLIFLYVYAYLRNNSIYYTLLHVGMGPLFSTPVHTEQLAKPKSSRAPFLHNMKNVHLKTRPTDLMRFEPN